ncbi:MULTISPECIES: FAD-dependent oxidoreductase [Pontibacillus]|uniref:FAD-dependent oxidoreductase n=1 Tax=Pontibacillus chungwhensis TaxID=265426 RepID=A0ABY8V552_9BACI|nr:MULTISPECIES: FAD-dependent oxidoreductase [Pontibacillus]MCD5322428.1 FAD-dependent oxidoreductase [Pontibacillus sp. HN14]WIF99714.1 FAD-dependent oxidoreductase [Pontibacillus chungwhensis]
MKYIIIGGDAAGMSAAMQIVRNSEGNEIVTYEKGETYSYGQCGLPYTINGIVESTEDLIARTPETFQEKYGIKTHTLHEVTSVDCEKKMVYGTNYHTGEQFEDHYDRLLVATGANPNCPPWEGIESEGIYTLKTIPDAEKIMDYINENIKNVTIIGGGYIGLEMAETLSDIGKNVQIIERGERLAKIFDEDMSALIHEEATKQNVKLTFKESVEGFKTNDKGRVRCVVTDHGEHATDLVLVAVGVTPNTSFLQGTGIFTSVQGAIEVNAYMESTIKDIYAAGDCATQYHRLKQKSDYIPLGTHANKQGRVAGLNMINQPTTFKGIVGSSIIKFFDINLGKTGLSEREAEALHFSNTSVTIDSSHAAGYYSKEDPMKVKLVYNDQTRALLGAQIIGKEGVDKRIDVVATALYHSMTVDELVDLDLSYAPPFNSVWDPIQQAARRA